MKALNPSNWFQAAGQSQGRQGTNETAGRLAGLQTHSLVGLSLLAS